MFRENEESKDKLRAVEERLRGAESQAGSGRESMDRLQREKESSDRTIKEMGLLVDSL